MGFGGIGGLVSGAVGAAKGFLPKGQFADAVGAAASIAGDTFAQQANLEEAQASRDFAKSTYLNRYQWTMSDMRKAGLNPILAYQQGAGSALGGAQARVDSATGSVLPAMNTAIQAEAVENTIKKQKAEISNLREANKNIREDTNLKKNQQGNVFMDTILKGAQELSTSAQAGVHSAQAARINQETVNAKLEQFRLQAVAEGAKSEEEIMKTTIGKYLRWLDVVGRSVNPFSKAGK